MSIKSFSSYLDATPRILLFFYSIVIFLFLIVIFSLGTGLNSPPILITASVVLLIWFVMIFLSLLPQTDILLRNRVNQLKRGALIIFVSLFVIGLLEAVTIGILIPSVLRNRNISGDLRQRLIGVQRDFGYNDSTSLSKQAVENLLHGENPYAHANVIQVLLKYDGTYDKVTPLRAGVFSNVFPYPQDNQLSQVWDEAIRTSSQVPPEIESRVCYPAASFLLPAPFIYLGITEIRIVYAIFILAGLAYAVWIIPKKKRLLFIGVVLISLELWNSGFSGGEIGYLCFPFLLIAWLALNRNLWLSAICMGLAVATKQTIWFFVPFYLILLFNTRGTRKLLAVISIIAGIFIITNLPFAVPDFKLWFNSVTSPMTDPMFPTGIGLITLVTSGLVKIKSSLPFTLLEGIAFIVAMVWYYRYCKRFPQTGLILAVIPLFFAWRSMFKYFFYVDIIALAYIMVNYDTNLQKTLAGANPPDNKPETSISVTG